MLAAPTAHELSTHPLVRRVGSLVALRPFRTHNMGSYTPDSANGVKDMNDGLSKRLVGWWLSPVIY